MVGRPRSPSGRDNRRAGGNSLLSGSCTNAVYEGIDGTTPAGRVQLHVLAALAEFERARIAETVAAGLARARTHGQRLGRPQKVVSETVLAPVRGAVGPRGGPAAGLGFGEGASPALYGDALIVNWDHEGQSFIMALEKATGRELWRTDRDEVTSWTTPVVVEHGGSAQIITSATRVRSYAFETGRLPVGR